MKNFQTLISPLFVGFRPWKKFSRCPVRSLTLSKSFIWFWAHHFFEKFLFKIYVWFHCRIRDFKLYQKYKRKNCRILPHRIHLKVFADLPTYLTSKLKRGSIEAEATPVEHTEAVCKCLCKSFSLPAAIFWKGDYDCKLFGPSRIFWNWFFVADLKQQQ